MRSGSDGGNVPIDSAALETDGCPIALNIHTIALNIHTIALNIHTIALNIHTIDRCAATCSPPWSARRCAIALTSQCRPLPTVVAA
eukprot:1189071-Prorocentrum_minimum.AAC.1